MNDFIGLISPWTIIHYGEVCYIILTHPLLCGVFFFKITRSSQWLRTERSVWVVKGRRCANHAQSTQVYSSQHCISASSRLNTLPCPREQTWQPNWASHRHRYEHDTNIHNKKTDRHSLDLIYQLCNFLWCSNLKGEKKENLKLGFD